MRFLSAEHTDVGIKKSVNQDGLLFRIAQYGSEQLAFLALCDGMGGLADGEIASNTVLHAFADWFTNDLPTLLETGLTESAVQMQWSVIARAQNLKIGRHAQERGIHMGTTAAVLLLAFGRYYALNIGDSRIYRLRDGIEQITIDQTFVSREVALGRMTIEQAKVDARRNVLLQCIGASASIEPDLFFGAYQENDVFLLCSDGFRHVVSAQELQMAFADAQWTSEAQMQARCIEMVELNKRRMENDNITVAVIKAVGD